MDGWIMEAHGDRSGRWRWKLKEDMCLLCYALSAFKACRCNFCYFGVLCNFYFYKLIACIYPLLLRFCICMPGFILFFDLRILIVVNHTNTFLILDKEIINNNNNKWKVRKWDGTCRSKMRREREGGIKWKEG